VGYATLRLIVFLLRALSPGEPIEEDALTRPRSAPKMQTAWKLAALVLPILLIIGGVLTWAVYRAEQRTQFEKKITQLISDSNKELDNAKRLAPTDRNAARDAAQKALGYADQARTSSPNDQRTGPLYYQARDYFDTISGITVLNAAPSFATFSDPKAKPTRIIVHWPDLFILDRGLQRVYHYVVNDIGSSATPTPGDGVILKTGDKVDTRTVGDLWEMSWLDVGRLAVLDRTGAYYQYDLTKRLGSRALSMTQALGRARPWPCRMPTICIWWMRRILKY